MELQVSRCATIGALLLAMGTAGAGENQWTETGPFASDVTARYSSNPNLAYARGGDKFWKSIDGGVNWTTKYTRNTYGYGFAVDPANPNVVLMSGPYPGALLKSTDGAETFSQVSFTSPYVIRFSADGSVVYAVQPGSNYLVRSTDRGSTWTEAGTTGLPTDPGTSLFVPVPVEIAIDRTDTSVVYLGYRHPDYQGVYKSIDGGNTWNPVSGLAGVRVNELVVHPSIPGRLYAATSTGLYHSVDAGATWSKVPDPMPSGGIATVALQSFAIDAAQPDNMYAGGMEHGEFFVTTDGGAIWARRSSGTLANRINSIAPRPGSSGSLLVGTSHTLYRTSDGGHGWGGGNTGIRASSVWSIQNGSRIRVGLGDGGIYESLNGEDWQQVDNNDLRARTATGRLSPVVEIVEGTRLHAMLAEGGVFMSDDDGDSWLPQSPSYLPANPQGFHFGGFLTVNGAGPVHLAGSNYGVYKTTNNGNTWFASNTGLPSTAIMAFAKNASGSAIYAGTFNLGVFRSFDAGANWEAASNGLSNLEIKSLAYDEDNDVLLVGTNDGLFMSSNGGDSYEALSSPMPGAVNAILIEDYVRGAFYVGMHSRVFRSINEGSSWVELSAGNQPSEFRTITRLVGDGPGVVYMGTMNGGLESFTIRPDVRVIAAAPPPDIVPVGTVIPWQFRVRNDGPLAATRVVVRLPIPAHVSVLTFEWTLPGDCSFDGTDMECEAVALVPGVDAEFTMTLRGDANGPLTLNPSVEIAERDPNLTNNSFTDASIRFVDPVDLAISLSASAASVTSGVPFEYTVVVRNDGQNPVLGADFETRFDTRDQYTLLQGAAAACTGSAAGVQRCLLPALAPGAVVTYRWSVTPQAEGARTATAVAFIDAQGSAEVNPANNSAAASLTVTPVTALPTTDLSIALAATAIANTGDSVTLTLTAANNSANPAPAVRVQLTLGAQLSYVSAAGATCAATAGVVTCDLGTIAAAGTAVVTVTASAASVGTATSSVTIDGTNPDSNATNNAASAQTVVSAASVPQPPAPQPPAPPQPAGGGGGGGGGAFDYISALALAALIALSLQVRRRRARRA